MKRLRAYNKFYRRYEVDLWGRSGFQRNNKTVRFLKKIQNEKNTFINNPGRTFKVNKLKLLKNKYFSSYKIVDEKKERQVLIKLLRERMALAEEKIKRTLSGEKYIKQKTINIDKSYEKKSKGKGKVNINVNRKVKKRKNNSFIYRIDYSDPQRKRAKTSLARELFLVKTKLLKFYNNIKKYQIRRYANTKTFKLKFKLARGYTNKALLKYNSKNTVKKRLALNAFFSLVEHRLDVLLFRSNLVKTMQQARQFINHRHVFVNNIITTHTGFIVQNFDVINLSEKAIKLMRKYLLAILKKKNITLYPPRYIYVDYRLMRTSIISNPLLQEIPFPFKIDLRKWLGLAKYMF